MTLGQLQRIAAAALEEDLGWGDLTSDYFIPPELTATANFVSRKPGVVAGLAVAAAVYEAVDPTLRFQILTPDGTTLQPGTVLARISGRAQSILRGERVALNFLQRLSGTASLTARYVDAVGGTKAKIVDTRKTTPGLRDLEKYAVRAGGGFNHRRNLSDGVMLKDNHLTALATHGLSLKEALLQARTRLPHLVKIEVEVDRLDQIEEILEGKADVILLDNMTPQELGEAVRLINGRAITEASGGVNLESVRAIAESGVDLISVGALTHSAPALDIGLDFIFGPPNIA
ncbi:MAG: carboxylating nicotinate-nucleotide diphosphorylase [Chloroflexi bacterium]|nr:carboxylating nicotinate-nucleotide diphosphorylase [Chloroflexota bacterium]